MRFPSPPYSNCPGGTCLTHVGTEGREYGGQGLQVIGVSMDDDPQPVRIAYRKYGLNYPVVMGDEKLGELYGGILGLPITFLIDAKGTIRFEHQGAANLNTIQNEMRKILQPH